MAVTTCYSNGVYNKLFTKILRSSIWLEPDATRIVWLTCLALMDEDGFVQAACPRNLAHAANVTIEACTAALLRLEGPDADSSDPDHDGARLERVPGGWMVLNCKKYKELATADKVRADTRRRVAAYRLRTRNAKVTRSETETETETDQQQTKEQSVVGASRYTRAPPAAAGRKRPRFSGQRFAIFDWMHDECMKILGPLQEAFDLDAWYRALDAETSRVPMVIPRDAQASWVFRQLQAEATRRGLPDATARPKKSWEMTDAEWAAHRAQRRKTQEEKTP